MEKTLIITRSDIEQLLTTNDYLSIIEKVHSCHAHHQVYEPDLLHADVPEGEFHIKSGGLIYEDEQYYGVKLNGGFLNNHTQYNLPNILGIIYLCNAKNGYPLAIMDSVAISRHRTGAASAIAAKYLAPQDSVQLGVFGYGTQAEIQIQYISTVCKIQSLRISGRNHIKAEQLVQKLQKKYPFPIAYDSLENTARQSNIIVTATASREAYLQKEWINSGTFIAAVGADSPGKQELDPQLTASSVIIADIRKQICRVGESQHALQQGLITSDDIYAELGEIITGQKPRPSGDHTIIYDSTGTALQDIGVAIYIYNEYKYNKKQQKVYFPQ